MSTQQPDPRIPPQAPEIEEQILAAIITDKRLADDIMSFVKKEWFYYTRNQKIFEILQKLHQANEAIDILIVEQKLEDSKLLEEIDKFYIYDITKNFYPTENFHNWLLIFKEKWMLREIITQSNNALKKAYDNQDPFHIIEENNNALDGLITKNTSKSGKLLIEGMQEVLSGIETRMQSPNKYIGYPTRLPIDELTSGWQKTDLIIIAARPSMGKTALVINNAVEIADNPNPEYQTPVAIFSLEMSHNQLTNRILSYKSKLNSEFMRDGKLKPEEFKHLVEIASNQVADLPIIIDETPAITLTQLKAKARSYVRNHGVGLIIIDYLQLMSGEKTTQNRNEEIGTISRGLKALAKELEVPIIALSQLSRAVEMRGGDKRPQMSDLRDSGSIEQDADVIMFLWRPEYYKIDEWNGQPTHGTAYAIIAKQRNGSVGEKKLNFHKETGRFSAPGDHLMSKAEQGEAYIPQNNFYEPDDPF